MRKVQASYLLPLFLSTTRDLEIFMYSLSIQNWFIFSVKWRKLVPPYSMVRFANSYMIFVQELVLVLLILLHIIEFRIVSYVDWNGAVEDQTF